MSVLQSWLKRWMTEDNNKAIGELYMEREDPRGQNISQRISTAMVSAFNSSLKRSQSESEQDCSLDRIKSLLTVS